MKPFLLVGAKGIGSNRLISLHEPHDYIASNQHKALDHTVCSYNKVCVCHGFCRYIGKGCCRSKADLYNGCRYTNERDGLDERPPGFKILPLYFYDGTSGQIEPAKDKKCDKL